MNCIEIIDFLASYIDGELPPETLAEFERHLAVCPSCVAYLETYRETIRAARFASAQKDNLVDDAPEELIAAIVAAARAK